MQKKEISLICDWCGSNPDAYPLATYISKVENCMNCRLDIVTGGTWTGNTYRAFLMLCRRYGAKKVVDSFLDQGIVPFVE